MGNNYTVTVEALYTVTSGLLVVRK